MYTAYMTKITSIKEVKLTNGKVVLVLPIPIRVTYREYESPNEENTQKSNPPV